MQRPTLTVTQVNKYIKDILSTNIILGNVLIKGEISNYKNHYSGHMYFTLKDENSAMKCIMFKTSCDNLLFVPKDGMKVIIQGRISVYEKDGSYQLYANEMQPDGVGSLHLAFEQLKKKLENEGLFDSFKKKKIPYLPKSIGVITSPTGAAVKDILNVISRRHGKVNIIIYPVGVQGASAGGQIANAIDNFNKLKNVDVIIVGRGGGSIEELWAFNEEIVARSISKSDIPIISAVGHETDFTIADFVSDLRAPTPSAAAELVVPNISDLEFTINSFTSRLKFSIEKVVRTRRLELKSFESSSIFTNPKDTIYQSRISLDNFNRLMINSIKQQFKDKEALFSKTISILSSLSPLNIMKRGYCIALSNQNIIKSIGDITSNQIIKLRVIDGDIECRTLSIEGGNSYGKNQNI